MTAAMAVATLLLTRQAQIPWINGLAAPWAIFLVVSALNVTPALAVGMPIVLYGSASLMLSVLAGNDAGPALRFLTILIGTILAFYVRPVRVSAPWVMAPIVLQAVLITSVSILLGLLQDPVLASLVRGTVLNNGWGDIYSFDGNYFRVQVIGNALLPVLFMVCLWRIDAGKFYRWGLFASSIGLVAAGNLTYFISVAFALVIRGQRLLAGSAVRQSLAGVTVLGLVAYSATVAGTLFERKFDGSDSSMGVRFDQMAVATEALSASPTALLFGAGLGAKFPDGRERDYSEFQYIELQVLYLTYQIGLIGIILYGATLWWSARRMLDRSGQAIFWLYILAGISNPYILDTNQIIVTMLLVYLFPQSEPRHAN